MCSNIAIQRNLDQVLKAQKQLALTISNQTSISMNGATYLTDTQFAEMAHIVSNVTDIPRLETPRNQGTNLKDQEQDETERSRLVIEKQEWAYDAEGIRKLEEGERNFVMRSKETAGVKKKKKSDGSISATPVAGMHNASTHVYSSSPPTFPPLPYHQHGPTTFPYALPSAYNLFQHPVYPPMGAGMIYPSFYGAPSYGQSHLAPPQTTMNINSGNFASVTISNVNNGKGRMISFAHSEYSHFVLFFFLIVARSKRTK
jgi:hypothetical protein